METFVSYKFVNDVREKKNIFFDFLKRKKNRFFGHHISQISSCKIKQRSKTQGKSLQRSKNHFFLHIELQVSVKRKSMTILILNASNHSRLKNVFW